MKLLLDTCTFLWLTSAPQRLSEIARLALDAADNELYLSHASFWEIAWKCKTGKLKLPDRPGSWVENRLKLHGIEAVAVSADHFFLSAELPSGWLDPFDRLLAAQAVEGSYQVITPEPGLASLGVRVLW